MRSAGVAADWVEELETREAAPAGDDEQGCWVVAAEQAFASWFSPPMTTDCDKAAHPNAGIFVVDIPPLRAQSPLLSDALGKYGEIPRQIRLKRPAQPEGQKNGVLARSKRG